MKFRAPLIAFVVVACRRDPAPQPQAPRPLPQSTPAPATGGSTTRAVAPTPAFDPPAAASAFREAGQYLPQGAPAPSWSQSGSVRIVNGQDLFQLIDGAGEKYMAYGFRQMARTDYRKEGTQFVTTAEIYDMGSVLGAYGQYSMLLSDGRDPATLEAQGTRHGGGGFLGTSQLVFWKGQHLVQINLTNENDDGDESALRAAAREALPAFAERIAASLPGETTAPAPAGLPREGVVWGGMTWLAQGVLGVERTGAGWVGHYRGADGARWRTALLERPDATAARAVVALFRGAQSTPVAGVGEEAFSASGAAGEVLGARKAGRVVVVAGAGIEGAALPPREARVATLRAIVTALP
jgi:hypothetical protein